MNKPVAKQKYEKPVILRHLMGLTNKFGHMGASTPLSEIAGVPVAKLLARYGSPLFVFSERALREKYQQAYRAFASRYPRVQFAWSYKTNYLDAVCAIFHQEGAWAEVVSELEYDKARRLGVPGKRIVYNGPYKTRASLEKALVENAIINIDNYDEYCTLAEIARRKKRRNVPVGLRINLDAGIFPKWDRFGLNLESGQAEELVRKMAADGRLKLRGLHVHLGTFILDPRAYRTAAEKLLLFARKMSKELGIGLDYLDLGGGFASNDSLLYQYLPASQVTPSFDQYAAPICEALQSLRDKKGKPPLLILESGRALVDEAGYLLARVVAAKRLPDGKKAYTIDVGVNALITAFWYRKEIAPAKEAEGLLEDSMIFGPLCMQIDVIRESIFLPALEVGDAIVIRNVGAYNITQSWNFIREKPPVVLIGDAGQVDLIKTGEDFTCLRQAERLPRRLKLKK
jgi:diaminopimelate decarboxylase